MRPISCREGLTDLHGADSQNPARRAGRNKARKAFPKLCPRIACCCHSPGMGPGLEASTATMTEASRVPVLPVTWHEYSPESAGDTWFSLSRGPWTWRGSGESGEKELAPSGQGLSMPKPSGLPQDCHVQLCRLYPVKGDLL